MRWHFENATSGEYTLDPPRWMGDVKLHDAHKSELMRRDPIYYGLHWPLFPMDLPMVWPAA